MPRLENRGMGFPQGWMVEIDAGTVTACEVAAEIRLAMRCLRHMPSDGPREPGCAWPDVYHSPHEAYGWLPAVINKIPPSTDAITRMDQVLFHWLPKLTDDERILVTARGAGLSWRKIMRIRRKLHSRSHEGHRYAHSRTIAKIAMLRASIWSAA